MTKIRLAFTLVLLASGAPSPGGAAVIDSAPGGFTVKEDAMITAHHDEVYRTIVRRVGQWWDPAHTFSGESRNISIQAVPGGCFCERLPDGGGVRHLTVVFVDPGKMIRFSGALGPLQQGGVAGSLTFRLTPIERETRCEMIYSVGGYLAGGLDKIAPAVDSVLSEQLQRLERFIETGDPNGE